MRCQKCGTENIEGSKFCQECGTKLEQKCPKCGASLPLTVKFCPECGTSLITGKTNGSSIVGDKNVIGGDVIGNKEDYNIAGNATFIKNEDETKKVNVCSICGRHFANNSGFSCLECGEVVCDDCFDMDAKKCIRCNAQDVYEVALQQYPYCDDLDEIEIQIEKLKKVISIVGLKAETLYKQYIDKKPLVYKVGDKGPAGGIIFYDKGQYSDGWRYLEAAPSDLPGCDKYRLGDFCFYTQSEIGTGKQNTKTIIEAGRGEKSAAGECVAYSLNGFNDWFLPSIDELKLMFEEKKVIGNFISFAPNCVDTYWSSSSENRSDKDYGSWKNYSSWVIHFFTGEVISMRRSVGKKTDDNWMFFSTPTGYIRPIRSF